MNEKKSLRIKWKTKMERQIMGCDYENERDCLLLLPHQDAYIIYLFDVKHGMEIINN